MKKFLSVILPVSVLLVLCTATISIAMPVFSFNEYVQLSNSLNVNKNLKTKVETALKTVVTDNSISKNPYQNQNYIKVSSWNIDGGGSLEQIQSFFSKQTPLTNYLSQSTITDYDKLSAIQAQIQNLVDSDIIILNDVDWGMPRSGYKNVAAELACSAGYNYAFAAEFINVDPYNLGLIQQEGAAQTDKTQYKGLSGTAILSKFPLENVRLVRLPNAYDWYNDEKEYLKDMTAIKSKLPKSIPTSETNTDIKIGGRLALIADVRLSKGQTITIVATQTEDRTTPKKRAEQVHFLLNNLKSVKNPLILGGNFNTNNSDSSPNDIKRLVKKNLNSENILKSVATGLIANGNIISLGTNVINSSRIKNDPTGPSLPILASNKEKELFNMVEEFKFSDGAGFEIKRPKTVYNEYLSSTNQRTAKGFAPTYSTKQFLGSAKFKLDWFFVKPDGAISPENPKTLDLFFSSFSSPLSDHVPLSVDLKY